MNFQGQLRSAPNLEFLLIKPHCWEIELHLCSDNTMSDSDWRRRKPDEYSATRWRTWLEERYPLDDSRLGSPLYQFLAEEVRGGRPGIALGDFLTEFESRRRKKEFPNVLHYWSGRETPWYSANDMTLPAPQGQEYLASAEVPTTSNCHKRKQGPDGSQTSGKRLKLINEEQGLEELTARNTKMNSGGYVASAHADSLPAERLRRVHHKVLFPEESKSQRRDDSRASDHKGPSPLRSPSIQAKKTTTEQSTRELKSAMKQTPRYSLSTARYSTARHSNATSYLDRRVGSPPIQSSAKSKKRQPNDEEHVNRCKRQKTGNEGISLDQPARRPQSAMKKKPKCPPYVSVPLKTKGGMPPVRKAPSIPKTGAERRATTIQIGLVPTLLMQAPTLHTITRKGFPMKKSDTIGKGTPSNTTNHSKVGGHSEKSTYPLAVSEESLRQISSISTRSERPASKYSPEQRSFDDDDDDDEDELAFKAAWDEALMPPPPRPTLVKTPARHDLESSTMSKQPTGAQVSALGPKTMPPTPVKQPQRRPILEPGTNLKASSPLNPLNEEVLTEQDAANESAPGTALPDDKPQSELIIARSATEATSGVADVSVVVPNRRENLGHRKGKVKDVVQKRELRTSTMAQRRNGFETTRSGTIRHYHGEYKGRQSKEKDRAFSRWWWRQSRKRCLLGESHGRGNPAKCGGSGYQCFNKCNLRFWTNNASLS